MSRRTNLRAQQRRRRRFGLIEQLETRRVMTVEIEPNDTLANATVFVGGDTLEGKVNASTDVDYFRINLEQGSQLVIATANLRDALFEPTFPPPVEISDFGGQVYSRSSDGRDLSFVAPKTGDYYVRMSSQSSFGVFTENYAMQTRLTAFSGTTEKETNDSAGQANALTVGVPFRGAMSTLDNDYYKVNLTAGQTMVLDFTGASGFAPGVRLLDTSDAVLATSLNGLGLSYPVQQSAEYRLQLIANSSGNSGGYVGVINQFDRGSSFSDLGDTLDNSTNTSFNPLEYQQFIGTLTSEGDVDVYRFDVVDFARLEFNLQGQGTDPIATQSRVLSLYDQNGRLLSYSTNGLLTTDRSDAISPGRYFVTVSSSSASGTGVYSLWASSLYWFSNQRDVALNFMDFDKQQPTHLQYSWINGFSAPLAIPFMIGAYESRMDAFDVDVTTTLPTSGERISTGIGNFGNMNGSLGWGDGWYGQRRPSGDSASTVGANLSQLSYDSWQLVNHEAGHAAGVPHIRSPLSTMAYVNATELFQVGDAYGFVGTDYRRPSTNLTNIRNYLDFAMQSGAQVLDTEPNDLAASPQSIISNFSEMLAEYTTGKSYPVSQGPHQILSADFNLDGNADVLVVSSEVDQVLLFIGDGAGGLTLLSALSVNNMRWWEENVAIGDFNNDGRPDIGIISGTTNAVGVALTNSNGTLGTLNYFGTVTEPLSIAAVDMNKDGNLDMVIGSVPGAVNTYLGTGIGLFGAPTQVAVGTYPTSLAIADYNGDTWPDVATSNDPANTLSVLLNDTKGKLTLTKTLPAGSGARAITTADFNGDGRPDLAAQGRDNDNVLLYLNSPSGFTTASTFPGHRDAETILAGDVNGDGAQDLVIGGFSIGLVTLINDGTGKFSRPVSIEAGNAEFAAVLTNLDNAGGIEIIATGFFSNDITVTSASAVNNLRNDRVAISGQISSATDVDRFSINVVTGQKYYLDIDAAEFQYTLDSTLTLLDPQGNIVAVSTGGLDRDSGLDSVDPYLVYTFLTTGTYQIVVSSNRSTAGKYRLKVTPSTAVEQDGPRLIAMLPDNGTTRDTTNQLMFFFDDQLDPATLTAANIIVRGQNTGVQAGTAYFNPLESSLTWTANTPLPNDTFTVTLAGGANGIKDLKGNALDGEVANNFRFPTISGNTITGGDFVASFTIGTSDTSPASLLRTDYTRDPYQRGQFTLTFSDELQEKSVMNATYSLRGAGPDGLFDTADDRLQPLDPIFDKILQQQGARLDLFSRGIPDADLYRIDASVLDTAGQTISISTRVNVGVTVPDALLFTDQALTIPGMTGSYVNSNLRSATAAADWRSTQIIAGTRIDPNLGFSTNSWGSLNELHLSGGTDANWDNFSAQWDGYIKISTGGTRLQLRSDESSRFWIDINNDGSFTSDELFNNNFGIAQGLTASTLSSPLAVGNYAIRVQYEEGIFDNRLLLEMIVPDLSGTEDGFGHGPSVIDTSIVPNSVIPAGTVDRVEVTFSGAMNVTSLNTQNFRLRFSSNPVFFDGTDNFIPDADATITWDPTTHKATLQTARAFGDGYYMIELKGSSGGIASAGGQLLDGEFMNSRIIGNTTYPWWSTSPSGDGVAGGDYRATFVVTTAALTLSLNASSISENGGTAVATLTRVNPEDVSLPQTVTLLSQDTTEISVPATVTIPAGQASVTFTVTAVDDTLIDGSQTVTIVASAPTFANGGATITVTDFEPLSLTIDPSTILEIGGTAQATITRTNSTGTQQVLLSSSSAKATLTGSITFLDGQLSLPVTISAVDNSLVDGPTTATITATSPGMISISRPLTIQDYEPLTFAMAQNSVSETGSITVTVTRTDSRGALTVDLSTDSPDELSLPASLIIPAGFLSATFTLSGVNDLLLDGTQTANIRATAIGYIDVSNTVQVLDSETLSLSLPIGTVSENGGQLTARAVRNDPRGGLTVALSADLSGQLSFPATINFVDGQVESEPFTISAIDNSLVDGTRVITLGMQAPGYLPGAGSITVTDFEQLIVTLVGARKMSENGGKLAATVTRTDTRTALQVTLASSDPSEATVPVTITIPAGQATSAAFDITAVDDSLLDGTQTATIDVSANGYVSDQTSVEIEDFESLDMSLAPTSIDEGNRTVKLTVFRLITNLENSMLVQLTSSDPTELQVPAEVLIQPGQNSVEINVSSVDDLLLDGTQTVTITASTAGLFSVSKTIDVTDFEPLTLSIPVATIEETAQSTTATVTRPNTDNSQPLIVNVSTNVPGLVTVPATVTIPAGQASASFQVTSIDDTLLLGARNVSVAIDAAGYQSANKSVAITDVEELTVGLAAAAVNENAGTTSITFTRSNTDRSQALTVQLTMDKSGVIILPTQVVIPAGQGSATVTATVLDDRLLTGPRTVLVSAKESRYRTGTATLTLNDIEDLTLSLTNDSLDEIGGTTLLSVTRGNTNLSQPLTVNLSADLADFLNLPSQLTILASQTTATTNVTTIDNTLLSGTTLVTITASAAGYPAAKRGVTIRDSEFLTLTFDKTTTAEGSSAIKATVARSNTNRELPVTVDLSAINPTQASMPSSVVIPAGSGSVTFDVTPTDDSDRDGDQIVQITAQATGYNSATASVTISDNENQFPWNNPRNALDVNNDTFVTAIDALLIINQLNSNNGGKLNPPPPGNNIYYDTSADDFLTAIDALLVINFINTRPAGEGEQSMAADLSDIKRRANEEFFAEFEAL